MRSRADVYRRKAYECERAAARVANPQVQASYRQMSRQWHEMAERQQTIDEALAGRGKAGGIVVPESSKGTSDPGKAQQTSRWHSY